MLQITSTKNNITISLGDNSINSIGLIMYLNKPDIYALTGFDNRTVTTAPESVHKSSAKITLPFY